MGLWAAWKVKIIWDVNQSTFTSLEVTSWEADLYEFRRAAKKELHSGIVLLSFGDAFSGVVFEGETIHLVWSVLLHCLHVLNKIAFRIDVQTQLIKMSHKHQDIPSYIAQCSRYYGPLKRKQMQREVRNPKNHKAPILLASMDLSLVMGFSAAGKALQRPWIIDSRTCDNSTNALFWRRELLETSSNTGPPEAREQQERIKYRLVECSDCSFNGFENMAYSEDNESYLEKTVKPFKAAFKNSKCTKSFKPMKCHFCARNRHLKDRCVMNPPISVRNIRAKCWKWCFQAIRVSDLQNTLVFKREIQRLEKKSSLDPLLRRYQSPLGMIWNALQTVGPLFTVSKMKFLLCKEALSCVENQFSCLQIRLHQF